MLQKSQMSNHYQQLKASGMSHAQAFAATDSQFRQNLGNNKPTRSVSLMIKTKSIQEKTDLSDGKRLSVMRFPKGDYDEDYRELAPSINLLMDYKKNKIDWPEYEKRYSEEMNSKKHLIKELADRAKKNTLTLLCFEKTDEKCHRRLLKGMIEKIGNNLFGVESQKVTSPPISKDTPIAKEDSDFIKNAPRYGDLPMNRKGHIDG